MIVSRHFVAALRRTCKIFLDNGTNFVGAGKEIVVEAKRLFLLMISQINFVESYRMLWHCAWNRLKQQSHLAFGEWKLGYWTESFKLNMTQK